MIHIVDPRASGTPLTDASEMTIGERYFVVIDDTCCDGAFPVPPREATLTAIDTWESGSIMASFDERLHVNVAFLNEQWWAYPTKPEATDPG